MGWFTGSAPTSTSTSSPSYARSRARNAARSPVSVLVKPALRVVALCWHHVSSVVVLSRVVIRDWLSGVAHHVQPGGGDDLAQNLDDAPPNVLICADRPARSTSPRNTAPGAP